MSISDSRSLDKNRQSSNRHRFIERHKERIKDSLNRRVNNRNIKDFNNGSNDIYVDPEAEPHLIYEQGGNRKIVVPGNEKYNKGDSIPMPQEDEDGDGGGGLDGEGEDSFVFELTKEEFMDLYFQDMELPDLVKKQLKEEIKYSLKTGGYSKDGIPPRLAIKKTFQNAIARRLANKKEGHKSPFLDDSDVRYIRKYRVPEPYTKAVMICMMDVSGSMTGYLKTLAKKFYILLYLFLTKFYKDIELVFIRYHSIARVTDEQDFFYGTDTGGTNVCTAQDLLLKTIEEKYNTNDVNIYVAHASDGDVYNEPREVTARINKMLDKVQYLAYLQVVEQRYMHLDLQDLYSMYTKIDSSKIGLARAEHENQIFESLYNLFRKKGVTE